MAKLSANGQRERLRLVRERETPKDPLISWERDTVVFMDSGKVLTNRTVRFHATLPGAKTTHTYGWKVSASHLLKTQGQTALEAHLRGSGYEVAAPK